MRTQALAHGNVAGFVAHEMRAGQIDAARHHQHHPHHHHHPQPEIVVLQQQPYAQQAYYASPTQVVVQVPADRLQQREFRQEAMAQRDLARGDVSAAPVPVVVLVVLVAGEVCACSCSCF
jgi:hypothetical protein